MTKATEHREASSATQTRLARSPIAIRTLAVLAVGTFLYLAHSMVVPVVLAVLFALILTTPVEALHRLKVPRSVTAILLLLLLLGVFSAAVDMLSAPAQKWWDSAPETLKKIEQKLQPVNKLVSQVEMISSRAGQMTPGGQPNQTQPGRGSPPAVGSAGEGSMAFEVFATTRTAIVGTLTTTILALFLLSGGPPMLARLTASAAKDLESTHVLVVINAVRSEVGRYYASIALINLGLGTATSIVTMLLGMPNPMLWGAIAALLNFIPYVGSATTLLLLLIVALVSFDSVGRVAAVGASYLALTTIEGQLIQPLVVGRRLELHPMIVFLALWFGGWFWGIAGIVIAVPSLVALKVIYQHSTDGQALIEFLSPNDQGAVKSFTEQAGKSIRKLQREVRR